MESRPAQKQQPSRKGKKSWRKNIDIEDVEQGIEESREDLINLGESLQQAADDNLFTVDVKGDERVAEKQKAKTLKSQEILARRSKAPALSVERNKRTGRTVEGVSTREIHRLMKLAGRVQGESRSDARLEKDGLLKSESYDLWNTPPPVSNMPEVLEKNSSTSWTLPKNAPKTLKVAPIEVRALNSEPVAGKSYNPSLESWRSLINEEYFKEKSREDQKIALQEHQKKIKELIASVDLKEELDSDSGASDEEEESANQEDFSLSINKPVVVKKKTIAQRNRKRRHQERTKLETDLKELRQKIAELDKIPAFEERDVAEQKARKIRAKWSKHRVMDEGMEVKLSSELSDSLRKLKPEGNLLHDQMRNMQYKGLVEARVPHRKKRKYAPKITEKWTYKDFK